MWLFSGLTPSGGTAAALFADIFFCFLGRGLLRTTTKKQVSVEGCMKRVSFDIILCKCRFLAAIYVSLSLTILVLIGGKSVDFLIGGYVSVIGALL